MKEVKNYVKAIITLLDEEQFFERAGIFMDRDIIEQFLIQTVTNNIEETGIPDLKPNQLEEVRRRQAVDPRYQGGRQRRAAVKHRSPNDSAVGITQTADILHGEAAHRPTR